MVQRVPRLSEMLERSTQWSSHRKRETCQARNGREKGKRDSVRSGRNSAAVAELVGVDHYDFRASKVQKPGVPHSQSLSEHSCLEAPEQESLSDGGHDAT